MTRGGTMTIERVLKTIAKTIIYCCLAFLGILLVPFIVCLGLVVGLLLLGFVLVDLAFPCTYFHDQKEMYDCTKAGLIILITSILIFIVIEVLAIPLF